MEVSDTAFEEYVGQALDSIPDALMEIVDNLVVLVEPEPPAGEHLLGLYVGTPLTARDSGYTFAEPDRILLFRGPLVRMCRDVDQLVREVRVTVVHEIAHHFGLSDSQLHSLGWG